MYTYTYTYHHCIKLQLKCSSLRSRGRISHGHWERVDRFSAEASSHGFSFF